MDSALGRRSAIGGNECSPPREDGHPVSLLKIGS